MSFDESIDAIEYIKTISDKINSMFIFTVNMLLRQEYILFN